MKHLQMTTRRPPPHKVPGEMPTGKRKPDAAFDIWLSRGLNKLYGEVAREPIPEDLLKLIEDDRAK